MVGGGRHDAHTVFVEDDTGLDLDHVEAGSQVRSAWCASRYSTSGCSIAAHAVDDFLRARRPEHVQRLRHQAHDPMGRDDVVQIADVVAVQVGQDTASSTPAVPAAAIRMQTPRPASTSSVRPPRARASRRPPGRVGQRVAGAEQDDVDRQASRHGTTRSHKRRMRSSVGGCVRNRLANCILRPVNGLMMNAVACAGRCSSAPDSRKLDLLQRRRRAARRSPINSRAAVGFELARTDSAICSNAATIGAKRIAIAR